MRSLLIGSVALLCVTGCQKNASPAAATGENTVASQLPPLELNTATARTPDVVRRLAANFQRVHFDTDSSSITPEGRAALDENAAILQSHLDIRVEVQGHADERGTVDYNLALGQRRAQAVTHYLTRLGVSPSRLHAMSLGEEQPQDRGHGEAAWSANRRAEFRLTWGQATSRGTAG